MDGYRHCAVPDPDAGEIPAIGETREGEKKDPNGAQVRRPAGIGENVGCG